MHADPGSCMDELGAVLTQVPAQTQDAVKRLPFAPLAVFSAGQAGTAMSAVAAAGRLAAGAWQAAAAAAGRPRKRPRV